MLRRIEDVTGHRWLDAVGKELHFSEATMYGVYADGFDLCKELTPTSDSLCHAYWDTVPLTAEGATAFLSSVGPGDVAYMIGAKSNTPLTVRRAAHAKCYGS
jgi:hypothetical protein